MTPALDPVTARRVATLRAADTPAQAQARLLRRILGEWALMDRVGLLDDQDDDAEREFCERAERVAARMRREAGE